MKTTLSDRLSLYLPIVLMGLLALGSWWLVRSAPAPWRPKRWRCPKTNKTTRWKIFPPNNLPLTGT